MSARANHLPHLSALTGAFVFSVLYLFSMFVPSAQTIILAVIGMLGLFSTAVILTYAFGRNRTGNNRFQ